jgi:hypothetical protein
MQPIAFQNSQGEASSSSLEAPWQRGPCSIMRGSLLLLTTFALGCGSNDSGKTNSDSTGGMSGGGGEAGNSPMPTGGKATQSTHSTGGTNSNGGATGVGTGGANVGGASDGGANVGGGGAGTAGYAGWQPPSGACAACLAKEYALPSGRCATTDNVLPVCDSFGTTTSTFTGSLNSDLCKAVYSCVMRTQCAFTSPTVGVALCYCGADNMGTDSEGSALCFQSQNGPCKTEIEEGMNLARANVTKTISQMGYVGVPAGAALNVLDCEVNNCGTECGVAYKNPGTGGAPSTGGAPGTGGAPSTGGADSAGGAGGAGGIGAGGNSSVANPRDCNILPTDTILVDFGKGAAGVTVNAAGSTVTPTFGSDTDADAGTDPSLKVVVPYTSWLQKAQIDVALPATVNLLGKSLFACVRLDSGPLPSDSDITKPVVSVSIGALDRGTFYGPTSSNFSLADFGKDVNITSPALQLEPLVMIDGTLVTDANGNPVYHVDWKNTSQVSLQFKASTPAPNPPLPSTATFHVEVIAYR